MLRKPDTAKGDKSVGVVILAAGESARMGQPKQLLPYGGTTLLRHSIANALTLSDRPVVVVLGANAESIGSTLADLPVMIVQNSEWRGGMGFSLRAGLNALLAAYPDTAAALFLLCDQPHVGPDLLQELLDKWRNGARMVACQYETRQGVPAVFDAALFEELLALEGAEGARQTLVRHAHEVAAIPFPAGAIDVDTPADYAALTNAAAT